MSRLNPVLAGAVPVFDVDRSPLQLPGRDERLATTRLAGPETGLDCRLMLSTSELEQLLEAARQSPVGRVRIDGVGIVVDTYRTPGGHQYEVWRFRGRGIKSEMPPGFDRG